MAPAAASANIAAFFTPTSLSGPDAIARTPLVVVDERLSIRCREIAGDPSCEIEAVYTINNPTEVAQEVVAAFYGDQLGEVTIKVDGVAASRALSAAEVEALDGLVRGVSVGLRESQPQGRLGVIEQRQGFDLRVDAGQTRQVMATVEPFKPGLHEVGSYATSAAKARHLLFAKEQEDHRYGVNYFLAPIRTWGGVGAITIEVYHPVGWRADLAFDQPADPEAKAPRWTSKVSDGERFHTVTVGQEAGDALSIRLSVPAPSFNPGGVLLGLGGAFGQEGGGRLRLGWEVAAMPWLLVSVAADSNLSDWLAVTPTVEVASPMALIFPSLGLGVGVPVRALPDLQVGVRGQLSVVLGPVGFVLDLDLYPGEDAQKLQTTLLGQLSF